MTIKKVLYGVFLSASILLMGFIGNGSSVLAEETEALSEFMTEVLPEEGPRGGTEGLV